MRKYFEAQLRNSTPCDGNALGPATREQVLETIRTSMPSNKDPEAYLDRKIQEYKDHVGEKLVYFLGYSNPDGRQPKVEVLKAWESEIDSLSNIWEVLTPAFVDGSTLPRFTEKVMTFYE